MNFKKHSESMANSIFNLKFQENTLPFTPPRKPSSCLECGCTVFLHNGLWNQWYCSRCNTYFTEVEEDSDWFWTRYLNKIETMNKRRLYKKIN